MATYKHATKKSKGIVGRLGSITLALSLLVLLLPNIAPRRVYANDGGLDVSFGGNGTVITSFDGSAGAEDVAIQTDGKIVAVGFARNFDPGTQHFALTRYDTSGNLDNTFGIGGKVTTDFGCTSAAFAVAIQTDGKIVAGGTNCIGTANSDFALARYNIDGSFDSSFGIGGMVTTDLFGQNDQLNGLVVQTDGKIVAVGKTNNGVRTFSDFAIVRYNGDGSLDTSFGTNGIVTTVFGSTVDSEAKAVVLDTGNTIIAAGTATSGSGPNMAVARYKSDGSPDPGFGTGGMVVATFASSGNGMTRQVDGSLVVAGSVEGGYGVARFKNDGSIDAGFGTGGKVNVGLNGAAHDVAIEGNKIVTAGFTHDPTKDDDFALARLDSQGNLDPMFGSNGIVTTTFTNHVDQANGLVIQTNGRIVAAGLSNASGSTNADFALARYLVQGAATAGHDTVGLYDPSASVFRLRNTNTSGGPDIAFTYGPTASGWKPIAGDWNGDGIETIGLYDDADALFFLRNTNSIGFADIVLRFGPGGQGWVPIAGDWNGDGVDTIGLYDRADGLFFLRNSNTTGFADIVLRFGPAGQNWIPIAGDWNGDGVDTVGLYDPADGLFFLRNSNTTGIADVVFTFGPAGQNWIPIAGDWNADGIDTIGLYNPTLGTFYLRNSTTTGFADLQFTFTPFNPTWLPIAGDWDGN